MFIITTKDKTVTENSTNILCYPVHLHWSQSCHVVSHLTHTDLSIQT